MATLKELRESRALAQRDLALLAGVSTTTIVDLEKGRRPPRPSTRRKLARALKVRPHQIDF
jgi:transcriptional regulator with XRE-family HTH domain